MSLRRHAKAPVALAVATGHLGEPAIPNRGPRAVYTAIGHHRARPLTTAAAKCARRARHSTGPGRTVCAGYNTKGLQYVLHPAERLAQEEWLLCRSPARGAILSRGLAQDPVLTKASWSLP